MMKTMMVLFEVLKEIPQKLVRVIWAGEEKRDHVRVILVEEEKKAQVVRVILVEEEKRAQMVRVIWVGEEQRDQVVIDFVLAEMMQLSRYEIADAMKSQRHSSCN